VSSKRIVSFGVALLLVVAASSLVGCSKNKGTNPLPPTGAAFDSGNLAPSATYQHTFATAGTFAYHCAIHTTMTGSVTVAASNPTSASVSIVNFAFSPSSVAIAPGGTVTWTNNGGSTHTVTSN
jgi:plastocyanin